MACFVPIPGHAAVVHLFARPLTPVLGMFPPQDMEVFRCASFDARLLANILGNLQPADMLRSAEGRMWAIAAVLLYRGVPLVSTTLWVHTGGSPPDSLEVSLPGGRRSRLPYLVTKRGRLSHYDTTVVGGTTRVTAVRAAVDIARLGTSMQAVQTILTACNHGVSRARLLPALNHCREAVSGGCPRAQYIIEPVVSRQQTATHSRRH